MPAYTTAQSAHTRSYTSLSMGDIASRVGVGTYRIEDRGALVVVHVWVNVVDPDGVDAEDLHESCIAKTLVLVAKGVDAGAGVVSGRATGLVRDTNDLVSGASGVVDEKGTLDVDGRHGCSQGGGAHEAKDGSLEL